MEKPAIIVEDLRKEFLTYKRREGVLGSVRDLFQRRYETLTAVSGISMQVAPGELLGYIGPNGAGKSTSIKMLTGILQPTSGRVEVIGFNPFQQRKLYTQHIGVVFGQRTQLWWDIAVIESFKLLAEIYGIDRTTFQSRLKRLDEVLELGKTLSTPVRKLSLGQRMRADLAASLLHQPAILFLDEPTIGLDVVAKDGIRSFLRFVNKELGTTILLTTHDLKEIEELCSRIIVIDQGRIMYDGELAGIRSLSGTKRSILLDFAGAAPLQDLAETFGSRVSFEREGERRIRGRFDPAVIPSGELLRTLLAKHDVSDLSLLEPDIEEIIVNLYRRSSSWGEVGQAG